MKDIEHAISHLSNEREEFMKEPEDIGYCKRIVADKSSGRV